MPLINGLRFDNILGDVYGGVTAAVVALPLALAFGVASGAGAAAGIYGAIFVGFFAALFGGTPAQVSGPTGPMTVVMAAIITQYAHEPAMAFTVVMMGGLIQILLGVFRVGQYIRLIPYPVISGFMTGIGCIIIILELAPLLGVAIPPGGPLASLRALPEIVAGFNAHAVAAGVITLAVACLWPARLARYCPPPLAALVAGTLIVLFLLPGAPVIGEIPTGLPRPQLPTFSLEALPAMLKSAMILALLGAIDSLLTSLIADNVSRTHHNSNRELIGQGIGNFIAGMFGGIPGAGATIRTVVNIRAGGRTPISGALHSLILLALMLGLAPLAAHIPHAVLAGILLKVGYDIIDWRYLRRLHRAPVAGIVIMLTVLLLTVLVDLVTAVGAGVVMASVLFVKRMHDLQIEGMELVTGAKARHTLIPEEAEILEQAGDRILLFRLRGPTSFGAARALATRFAATGEHDVLVLDLTDVPMIDTSGSLAIEDVIVEAQALGMRVFISGVSPRVGKVLDKLGIPDILADGGIEESRLTALKKAAATLT